MKYILKQCSWNITSRCNLNCKHCCEGGRNLNADLDTQEALKLVDQIIELKPQRVTFSGGEPFVREDWHLLAGALIGAGISVGIITNGTLLNEETVERIKSTHVSGIGVSIDGIRERHDDIRGEGCYKMVRNGVALLKKNGIPVSVVTTIMKHTLPELPALKKELVAMGIMGWQLQVGLPVGNLKKHNDLIVDADNMNEIIDFCYDASKDGDIAIFPADCIGYFTKKEIAVKKLRCRDNQQPEWMGCRAGISSFTILNDGSVVDASMVGFNMGDDMTEGNFKEKSLKSIWEDPSSFSHRRNLDVRKFEGFCKTCVYLERCLGGCTAVRCILSGGIYKENPLCVYRNFRMKNG